MCQQVHAYEVEKLEKKCRELGNELEEQKKYFNKNYIPQEEIEEFKRALETKVISLPLSDILVPAYFCFDFPQKIIF